MHVSRYSATKSHTLTARISNAIEETRYVAAGKQRFGPTVLATCVDILTEPRIEYYDENTW